MAESLSILGCFVSSHASLKGRFEDDVSSDDGEIFRRYIWGELGICPPLKSLKRSDYGNDLQLVLLQFYVNPMLERLVALKEIERYRPKERAIGIPIIVHDYNFFNKSEMDRREFLQQTILDKLDLLAKVVKRNKLDTNIARLKSDVERVLS